MKLSAPPASGHGRLVVDVVEGPTPVSRILARAEPIGAGPDHTSFRLTEVPEPLCPASPCVLEVSAGNVLLGFPVIGDPGRLDSELVHVGDGTAVYRRSLSVYQRKGGALRVIGIVMTSLGASAAITGAVLLPVGRSEDNDGLTTAGGITLGAGAVFTALGIWAIRHTTPTYRPGSTNHFPMPSP